MVQYAVPVWFGGIVRETNLWSWSSSQVQRKVGLDQGYFVDDIRMESERVKHLGGCHCGAVRFEVTAPKKVTVFNCNCSVCTKKQNRHFVVPESRFKLLQGEDNLTCYTFNTKVAQHTFCKTCGVQSFYTPRSNPDGKGVAVHCLDEGTLEDVTVVDIDGLNWEKAIAMNIGNISQMSKETDQLGDQ